MNSYTYRQTQAEQILCTLISDGEFEFAVLASKEGLPLAKCGAAETEIVVAVAAALKSLAERAHEGITEIIVRDNQKGFIVNRFFTMGEDFLLLSIKVPHGKSYLRLTNRAIRHIRSIWSA